MCRLYLQVRSVGSNTTNMVQVCDVLHAFSILGPRTPGETVLEVRKISIFIPLNRLVQELSNDISHPYMPNIGMSYTIGKLLNSPFQWLEVRNCILRTGLPVCLGATLTAGFLVVGSG